MHSGHDILKPEKIKYVSLPFTGNHLVMSVKLSGIGVSYSEVDRDQSENKSYVFEIFELVMKYHSRIWFTHL